MSDNSSNQNSEFKKRLALRKEPEELVINEELPEEDDLEVTVAQSSDGDSLTLLEEYKKRSGNSHRWTLAFNAACAITSIAFTLLTLQKIQ